MKVRKPMSRAAKSSIQRSRLLQVAMQKGFQPVGRQQAIFDQAFQPERVGRGADRQGAVGQLQ